MYKDCKKREYLIRDFINSTISNVVHLSLRSGRNTMGTKKTFK